MSRSIILHFPWDSSHQPLTLVNRDSWVTEVVKEMVELVFMKWNIRYVGCSGVCIVMNQLMPVSLFCFLSSDVRTSNLIMEKQSLKENIATFLSGKSYNSYPGILECILILCDRWRTIWL